MEIILERKGIKWLSDAVGKRLIAFCAVAVFLGWLQCNTQEVLEVIPETQREVASVNDMLLFSEPVAEVEYFNRKIAQVMEMQTEMAQIIKDIPDEDVVVKSENSLNVKTTENASGKTITSNYNVADIENSYMNDESVTNPNINTDTNTNTPVFDEGTPEALPQVPTWTVTLYGNGGVPESDVFTWEGETVSLENREIPYRLGKEFSGWYLDAECTTPFTGVDNQNTEVSLYAGWKEIDGVACDDNGYIVSCEPGSVVDGLLAVPTHSSCTGIETGAFSSVADMVEELYIPSNITYIAPGVLDVFTNLLYIEVASDNPVYYSDNGNLYEKDGEFIK